MKAISILAIVTLGWAQEISEDRARKVWSTEFRKARAESVPAPPKLAPKPLAIAPPKLPVPPPALLGVTVWLLKPSKQSDNTTVRALVHEKGNRPHTPVRVSSGGQFYEGDHIRLTVESGRAGYLYVVSRERYADGSLGLHQLVFPTTRIRGGDNLVRAGFPVELPLSTDDPSYFTLKRSRPDHTGEEVLFIVAPKPLNEVTVTDDQLTLDEDTVKSWQAKWRAKTQWIEIPDDQDRALTPEELQLLRQGRPFKESDPLPQTLYRVESQPDQPVLVGFQLQMSRRPTQ